MTILRRNMKKTDAFRDVQIHETFGGQQVQHNVQFWWT